MDAIIFRMGINMMESGKMMLEMEMVFFISMAKIKSVNMIMGILLNIYKKNKIKINYYKIFFV